ncbi:MAG: putative selenium-dependent hydroxylase accessory protein YqeC [Anaerolineaceae bacterium]|nr:putative selenium-dependent hydroxylase accessory protein YqeC [Anaerolineaceae bacterium]
MKLQKAFEIVPGDVVAFVGGGGKTATLISLGHELAQAGLRVVATTTSQIAVDELGLMPFATTFDAGMAHLSLALGENRFVFLYGDIKNNLVYGPNASWIPRLLDTVDSDVMLIEADYAGGLPLKAPMKDEPYIPPETTLVVPMASLAVLGQPLDEEHVYNASAIDERYGFLLGNRVRSPWVAQVLRDEELGLRGVPSTARIVSLLNQTPPHGYARGRARLIAQLILRSSRIHGVAMGSVRSGEPIYEVQKHIGAVVLAAGMSRRMGQPKVLLPWGGRRTILEHIIEQLSLARVPNIKVVTGHRAGEVRQVASRAGADVIHNDKYTTGEMLSSLKAGLRTMPEYISAALVVLGDQPRIQPKVISQVMMSYAEGTGDIVAPSYQMRRGHPILIDRRYWPEILDLPDDGSPREVIDRHKNRIAYVNVDTDSVLRDVDTPEDYRQERRLAGLDG